jgi:hypothetical protein
MLQFLHWSHFRTENRRPLFLKMLWSRRWPLRRRFAAPAGLIVSEHRFPVLI